MISNMSESVIHCCCNKHQLSDMEKSRSELEFLSNITEQLLIEILIRLPNISACRYKAVCKDWYYLISSNYFITRFINHHHQLNGSHFVPDSFNLVFQYTVWCSSPSGSSRLLCPIHIMPDHPVLSKSDGKPYVNLDFLPRNIEDAKMEPFRVQTSCHDLLLCTHFATYYVVNLLTKQWIVLPPVPPPDHRHTTKRYPNPGLICSHGAYGIGNASGWCRFKVILVSNPREIGSSLFGIRIFCSKSGQWTKRTVDWYPWTADSQTCSSHMIPHNGMLHWLNGYSLVSLDIFNGDPDVKLSRTIKLQGGLVIDSHFILGVSQGHLRVALYKHEGPTFHSLHVWELEDYHKGLWRLEHWVPLPRSLDPSFNLMAFHPYKRDIIFVRLRSFVYHLNMQTGRFERYLKLKHDKDCSNIWLSRAVVLLHQWFPTPL